MLKYQVSAKTATGDTVKTLIDTMQVPASARALLGVGSYAIGSGAITTAETPCGILELESDDINLQPMQLPLDVISMLTGGSVALQVKIWPMNVPLKGGEKIKAYVTMDMAQTGALTARVFFVYDIA